MSCVDAKYLRYAQDVLDGKIVACKYVKQACKRYLSWFDKYEFRSEEVDKVVNFASKLKHFTGSHNGKPFVLSDFQFWIVCAIFGFYNGERRVIRNVYIELARKNGKSFFAAMLSLYCMIGDGENNAEVEVVANSAKQAGILFTMCKTLTNGLDKKHKYFDTYRDSIRFDKTHSFLQILANEASTNDGWNSSCYVVDEYHEAKDSSMYDVLKSSQGMRDNPLAIVITTAGFNLFGPCYQMRQTYTEILSGIKQDDTVFAAIYELDEGDDWTDPNTWIKCNPNLDITVKRDYLQEQVTQAINQQSMEVAIRTKNFNTWMSSSDVWIQNQLLIDSTREVTNNDFYEKICYVGVDLASVSDLTAASIMTTDDEGHFIWKTRYYLPETCLYDNPNSTQYREWKRTGQLIITPGNVTDYDYIINDMQQWVDSGAMIDKVAYDAYNSTQWAISATELGFPLEPYPQSLWSFNRPTKEFERLVRQGRAIIDNNEITRWCFSNVALKYDHNENCKPVKGGNQLGKIDGVIAMLEALGSYLSQPHYQSSIISL